MSLPFKEVKRFLLWRDKFLEDLAKIEGGDLEPLRSEIKDLTGEDPDTRLLKAIKSMYVGGMERRLEDPWVRRWALWGGLKTYETFNGFPGLEERELCFVFYSLGKIFIPLLLHERGVRSEAFRKLSREDQEKAVLEELDTIWETQLTLILQSLQFLDLRSTRK
jgi:hypothetical protein